MKLEEQKGQPEPTLEETKEGHRVYLTTEAILSRNSAKQKTINEFTFQETIGHGAFSKVKKVVHGSGKAFAMKIMHKPTLKRERALAYGPDGIPSMTNNLEKVYNEIENWSKLDHKNVVKLYEIIDDLSCDYLYLVMDWADLGQIADWEKETEKYKRNEKIVSWILSNKFASAKFANEQEKIEKVAKYVFQQIVDALVYLHEEKNIVHRDIKPDNILFSTAEGTVQLTDFTVAKQIVPGQEVCFDTEGTAAFTAPECSTVMEGYKPKPTDIWSLGMCLHTYIGEEVPFYAESELEMQLNAQNKELVIPKTFSAQLADLLKWMLTKEPEKRPTIKQVREHPWFGGKEGLSN